MAKYRLTYQCGHESDIYLTGPHKDRNRRIAWLETNALCHDCLRQQHRDAGRLSAEICRQAGLPDLAGSDKQVGWANQVRVDTLKLLDELDATLTAQAIDNEQPERQSIAEFALFELDDIRAELLGCISAHWWIEQRDSLTRGSLRLQLSERLKPMEVQIKALAEQERAPISRDDQREIYRILRENKLAELRTARQAEAEARAAERSRAAAEAAETARHAVDEKAASEARRWANRDRTAQSLLDAGIDACDFTVWMKGAEKRIYLDRGNKKVSFFATGNAYHRPGSIDVTRWTLDEPKLAQTLQDLSNRYTGPVRFGVRDGKAVR